MNYSLIDTHCHVNFRAYENDLAEVINRCSKANIAMITVGSQIDTSRAAVSVAEKYQGVWAAVGLHPNHLHAQEFIDDQEVDQQKSIKTRTEKFSQADYLDLARHPKVVAIGENGLDYYRLPPGDHEQMKEDQKNAVREHIKLSHEIGKPIIVHCRDAHADQLEILKSAIEQDQLTKRGVIHCFTGTLEEAQKYIEIGFLISLTGILTFSKELQTTVQQLPLSSLMVETDAPYLTPVPHRGKRNEPMYVQHVAKCLAELKGVSFEEIAEITTKNAIRIFQLDRLS